MLFAGCNTKETADAAAHFYQQLYSKGQTDVSAQDKLLDSVTQIDQDKADLLNASVSAEELEDAVQHLKDKAPGWDGLTALFWRSAWPLCSQAFLKLATSE